MSPDSFRDPSSVDHLTHRLRTLLLTPQHVDEAELRTAAAAFVAAVRTESADGDAAVWARFLAATDFTLFIPEPADTLRRMQLRLIALTLGIDDALRTRA